MRKRIKGYGGRDSISHRRYKFSTAINRLKRTKQFTFRGKGTQEGSGHLAGEKWAEDKEINPESETTKYSKNSPSFDEGVYIYKSRALSKAKS